jgi:hypothetical protein
MVDIVNLRLARKAKARDAATAKAAQNRATFGQTKMSKQQIKADVARIDRMLDDLKRVR